MAKKIDPFAYKQPAIVPFLLWLYRAVVGRIIFGLVGGCRVYGREKVPKTGGLLILPNHLSTVDPPFTQFACPRRIYYMANKEVFEWEEAGADGKPPGLIHKFSSWLAHFYGAFPVTTKSADRAALRRAVELLKAGETVCIYPEGGTSPGGLQPLFAGPALILRQAKCQVICLGLRNTGLVIPHKDLKPRRSPKPIEAHWGDPHTFDEKAGQEEILSWVETELYRLTGFKPEDRVIEAPEEVQPGIEGKREQ